MDIKFDTLKYLVNNDLSLNNENSNDANLNDIKLNKKDKKFYKKRLLAVTKLLFKEDNLNKSPKSTQLVFENYVNDMIQIFKDSDLNEERKNEYNKLAELNKIDNNKEESLNLLDYDMDNLQMESKQIKIEDCMKITNLKKEKKPFMPKEKIYNLKTEKNKKKRNI